MIVYQGLVWTLNIHIERDREAQTVRPHKQPPFTDLRFRTFLSRTFRTCVWRGTPCNGSVGSLYLGLIIREV